MIARTLGQDDKGWDTGQVQHGYRFTLTSSEPFSLKRQSKRIDDIELTLSILKYPCSHAIVCEHGCPFFGTGHLIFKVVAQHLPAFLRLKRLEVKTGFMWFQLKALNLKHHNFLVLFSEVFVVKNSQTVLPKSSTQHFYTEFHHVSPQIQVNQYPKPATSSPTSVRTREMDLLKAYVAYDDKWW